MKRSGYLIVLMTALNRMAHSAQDVYPTFHPHPSLVPSLVPGPGPAPAPAPAPFGVDGT